MSDWERSRYSSGKRIFYEIAEKDKEKMIFLGTGASEGIPDPFCSCEVCRKARESGDPRDIRGRSAFLIDEHNLVDFGPDAHLACERFGVPLIHLKNIFYTHFHSDHFSLTNWESLRMSLTPQHIRIYLSEPAFEGMKVYRDLVSGIFKDLVRDFRFYDEYMEMIPLKPFETFETDGMTVSTLKTIHNGAFEGETALNYLFERNGRRFLYASDTGLYGEDNYEFLEGKALDYLIMECTFGNTHHDDDFKHLTCESIERMVSQFRKNGTVTDRTEIWLTHIGHKGGLNHEELQAKMQNLPEPQINIAYDGLNLGNF